MCQTNKQTNKMTAAEKSAAIAKLAKATKEARERRESRRPRSLKNLIRKRKRKSSAGKTPPTSPSIASSSIRTPPASPSIASPSIASPSIASPSIRTPPSMDSCLMDSCLMDIPPPDEESDGSCSCPMGVWMDLEQRCKFCKEEDEDSELFVPFVPVVEESVPVVEPVIPTGWNNIGVTWISPNKTKGARADYERELNNSTNDEEYIRWDDAPSNNLVAGDLFAFVDARNGVEGAQVHFHRIESIVNRRAQWNENYVAGATNSTNTRNGILIIRTPLLSMLWIDYVRRVGYNEKYYPRGTTYLKKGL